MKSWPIRRNPHVYLDSGVVLSIQEGTGYYCSVGTYEVMPMRIERCPYGWRKHIDLEPWGESSVFCNMPADLIASYIQRQGIGRHETGLLPQRIQDVLNEMKHDA
tara:strand:+ start:53 stop:367 length:315 start_codon:yes stop_codon:yes gene_type:complete